MQTMILKLLNLKILYQRVNFGFNYYLKILVIQLIADGVNTCYQPQNLVIGVMELV